MRTTIFIDADLMAAALKVTGLKTKREVVALGLRTLVKLCSQGDVRRLRGERVWEGDLNALSTDGGL